MVPCEIIKYADCQKTDSIKTTGEAGGMHHAFKALMLAASQDASKDPPTANFSRAAAKAAFSFFRYALEFLLPVNGSMNSLNDNWSYVMSSCN